MNRNYFYRLVNDFPEWFEDDNVGLITRRLIPHNHLINRGDHKNIDFRYAAAVGWLRILITKLITLRRKHANRFKQFTEALQDTSVKIDFVQYYSAYFHERYKNKPTIRTISAIQMAPRVPSVIFKTAQTMSGGQTNTVEFAPLWSLQIQRITFNKRGAKKIRFSIEFDAYDELDASIRAHVTSEEYNAAMNRVIPQVSAIVDMVESLMCNEYLVMKPNIPASMR
jgi:hypothetical protein